MANYGWHKMETGANYAASLQQAMGDVLMDITRSGESAADPQRMSLPLSRYFSRSLFEDSLRGSPGMRISKRILVSTAVISGP